MSSGSAQITHYTFKSKQNWKRDCVVLAGGERSIQGLWYLATSVQESSFPLDLLPGAPSPTLVTAACCVLRAEVLSGIRSGLCPTSFTTPWLLLPQLLPNGSSCSSGALPCTPWSVQRFALGVIRRTKCFCSGGVSFLGLRVFNENFRLWMCHRLIAVPYCVASCWAEVV